MWTILKVITELVTISFPFYVMDFVGHEACRILAPQPEIKPAPPALTGEVWTTGLPGKSPQVHVKVAKSGPLAQRSALSAPSPNSGVGWGEFWAVQEKTRPGEDDMGTQSQYREAVFKA